MGQIASTVATLRIANLALVQLLPVGRDWEAVLQAGSAADRFFPPLLAARMFLAVRGLIEQDCDSRPESNAVALPGEQFPPMRRWAFAQEIYSNHGRGTESGHFLEHLTLQMASELHEEVGGDRRVLSADTSWDFRVEPNVYRLRFYDMTEDLLRASLRRSQGVLAKVKYHLDLRALGALT